MCGGVRSYQRVSCARGVLEFVRARFSERISKHASLQREREGGARGRSVLHAYVGAKRHTHAHAARSAQRAARLIHAAHSARIKRAAARSAVRGGARRNGARRRAAVVGANSQAV
ncbi:hypothetical protein FGB62_10g12 [Gracilaria domingensis]|nr:hypothetical protein FGB62_10g12 [Gracilaria domingensis]